MTDENNETNDLALTGDEDLYDVVGKDRPSPQFATASGNQQIEDAKNEEGLIEAKVDATGAGNILSSEIYTGESGAPFVREYAANAETGCIRACKLKLLQEGVDPSWFVVDGKPRKSRQIIKRARDQAGYHPVIEIEWHKDDRKFIIKDNGIGMTYQTFLEVFIYTARSGVHADFDTTGKFGVGALSVTEVLGDGRLTAEISSLKNGEEIEVYGHPLIGYKPMQTENVMPRSEHGVKFEVPISENVGTFDARTYVERYCEKLKVPVIYTEYSNGEEIYSEEYGNFDFTDMHDYVGKIERPGEFTLIFGNECGSKDDSYGSSRENDVYLHSFKIGNRMNRTSTMYPFDLRIENEHGLIIEGPNKGKMAEEVKVESDDVVLPTPTTSRDQLSHEHQLDFEKYITKAINDKCRELAGQYIEDLDSYEDVVNWARKSTDEFELLWKTMNSVSSEWGTKPSTRGSVITELGKEAWPDISEDARDAIALCYDWVTWASDDRATNKSSRSVNRLYEVIAEPTKDVYMAKSVNREKVQMLYHNKPNCVVVACDSIITKAGRSNSKRRKMVTRDHYEIYEKLGFKLLKSVPTANQAKDMDDWRIPEILKTTKDSEENKPTPVSDKVLTVHTRERQSKRYTEKPSVESCLNAYTDKDERKLVLFTPDSERSLSENRWVGNIADFANANKKEAKELLKAEGIINVEQLIEQAKEVELQSPSGSVKAGDVAKNFDEILMFVVSQEEIDKFNTPEVREALLEEMEEMKDAFYCVVSDTQEVAAIGQVAKVVEVCTSSTGSGMNERYRPTFSRNMYHYMATTPNWSNGDKIYSLLHNVISSGRVVNGEAIVDAIIGLHDLGLDSQDLSREKVAELCDT